MCTCRGEGIHNHFQPLHGISLDLFWANLYSTNIPHTLRLLCNIFLLSIPSRLWQEGIRPLELHGTNVAVWYGEISGKQAEGLFGGWWFHVGSLGCFQSWPLKASERTRRGSSIEHQVTRQGLMNSWRRSWWFNIALYISESSCLDSRPPLPSLQSTQMGGAEPSWWQML